MPHGDAIRAELTAAQRSAAIKRRKEIWEALHPNTVQSLDEKKARGRPVEFASDTAYTYTIPRCLLMTATAAHCTLSLPASLARTDTRPAQADTIKSGGTDEPGANRAQT